jgi:predicted metal-dependent hydrolase
LDSESLTLAAGGEYHPGMIGGAGFEIKRSGLRALQKSSRTYVLDGAGAVLFVKTRRARRISLTLRASRGVRVAVPWRVSFDEARRVALTKMAWLRRTLAHVERARGRCREAVLASERLDRRTARAYLSGRLDALAREHGYSPGRLSVRRQGTVWGSASSSGRIQLNAFLAVVPTDLADYVILHELVHTRVRGHGRTFWAELESRMPDARRRQSRLREYSLALF